MLARRARTSKSWDHVFNFRTCDVALSSLITFNRPDASTCATRRRAFGAVGPSRTLLGINSATFTGWGAADTGGGFGAYVTAPDGTNTAREWTVPTATGSYAFGQVSVTADASGGAVWGIWARLQSGSASLRLSISDVNIVTRTSPNFTVDTTWRYLEFDSATVGALNNTGNLGFGFTGTGLTGGVTKIEFWHPVAALGRVLGPYIETAGSNVTTTDWPRTNYIAKSNKFSSAFWSRVQSGTGVVPSIVSEVVPSPTGSLDATRITFDQGAGDTLSDESVVNYYQAASLTTGAPYSAGIWARIPLGITISARTVGSNAYMAMVGTGQWKRYSRPETAASAFSYLVIGLRGGLGIGQSTGRVTVDLWHCTLEPGSELTATIPNDTSAPLTVNTPPFGQMVTVPANVPVLEYDADGIGRGLRVEKGSRNLAACSGFLDSTDDPAKVLAEPGFPDSSGGYNAFRIRAIDSTGLVFAQQITPTSGELVAQIVLKRGNSDSGGNGYGFYNRTTAADLAYVSINYATGALTKFGPLAASLTATAVPHGDNLDWWLLTLQLHAGFSASDVLNFYMGYLGGSATIGDFHYIDWVQVEPGLLATSYIRPVSAGVVPVRDPASASMVPSAVGLTTTSGTLLIDCEVGNTSSVLWQLGSAADNTLHLTRDGNTLRAWCNRAGVAQLANIVVGTPFTTSNRVRVAAAWSFGRIYVVVNGGEPNIFNASVPTSFADLSVGYYPYGGSYHIDGTVHELRTASRTLTIAELVRESAL